MKKKTFEISRICGYLALLSALKFCLRSHFQLAFLQCGFFLTLRTLHMFVSSFSGSMTQFVRLFNRCAALVKALLTKRLFVRPQSALLFLRLLFFLDCGESVDCQSEQKKNPSKYCTKNGVRIVETYLLAAPPPSASPPPPPPPLLTASSRSTTEAPTSAAAAARVGEADAGTAACMAKKKLIFSAKFYFFFRC